LLYFANPCGEAVVTLMQEGVLGFIDTPHQQNIRPADVFWCADNGCFSSRFKEDHWWRFLERHADDLDLCAFATAPDVVGDARATLERSLPWLPKIRALGYPAAFVAQDGIENTEIPWDEFDAWFIGGTNEFKLGELSRELVAEALSRGKWVHMGRVNSKKRWKLAESWGCDSADGTFLTYGPAVNLPKLLNWFN
jgi:hypothetical protein